VEVDRYHCGAHRTDDSVVAIDDVRLRGGRTRGERPNLLSGECEAGTFTG
jgi:hypothetical protein